MLFVPTSRYRPRPEATAEKPSTPISTWKEKVMLVLSRKKHEAIVINNDIVIMVVDIRGDKVRLGIDAPKEVPVHRREIYDAIHRQQAPVEEPSPAGPEPEFLDL